MSAAAAAGKRDRLWHGETFDYRGYTFRFTVEADEWMGEPWKEHDGHGPVSDWTRRAKRPGERVLCEDRDSRRYYDYAEAVRIARRDQWGSEGDEGLAAGAKAARAADRDFEYLQRWAAGDWYWIAVVVEVLDDDGKATDRESIGGIDGDQDDGRYLTSTAYELADEIVSRLEVDDPDIIESVN